ncbi:Eukaryotic translation initiation factor 3 subunit D [Balamuthia mandrillaris]
MASFNISYLPTISDNPTGWGPTEESIPESLKRVPYAPFSKSEKLGKAADSFGYKGYRGSHQGSNQAFDFRADDEEGDDFQLVDSKSGPKKKGYGQGFRGRRPLIRKPLRRRGEALPQNKPKFGRHHEQRRKQQSNRWQKWGNKSRWGFRRGEKITREASVEVGPEWTLLEQTEFAELNKSRLADIPEPETVLECGVLDYYNPEYDTVTVPKRKTLERIDRTFFQVTTTDDPIINKLSIEEDFNANIFLTDAILAHLMCAPRSNFSWDIIVRRVGANYLFFDKRDNSQFDYLTVNETMTEAPASADEEMNSLQNLSLEASYINQNFSQQVLIRPKAGDKAERYHLQEPNPFQGSLSEEELSSVAYRYRKWDLGDGNVVLCRCEVDAVAKSGADKEFVTIKALNEYDPKITGDWRQKLDSQRGAVLATELKNNSNKLAKWTVQSLLNGSAFLKLGYVSRAQNTHQILGTQSFKPKEFAHQIGLNESNLWGIFKYFVDLCMELEEGTYIFLKDPNKPLIRLYEVPEDAFDNKEEGDDDEDEDEEEEDVEGEDDFDDEED